MGDTASRRWEELPPAATPAPATRAMAGTLSGSWADHGRHDDGGGGYSSIGGGWASGCALSTPPRPCPASLPTPGMSPSRCSHAGPRRPTPATTDMPPTSSRATRSPCTGAPSASTSSWMGSPSASPSCSPSGYAGSTSTPRTGGANSDDSEMLAVTLGCCGIDCSGGSGALGDGADASARDSWTWRDDDRSGMFSVWRVFDRWGAECTARVM